MIKNKITAQEIESANIQPLFEMRKFFSCFFSGTGGTSGTGESASRTGDYGTGGSASRTGDYGTSGTGGRIGKAGRAGK